MSALFPTQLPGQTACHADAQNAAKRSSELPKDPQIVSLELLVGCVKELVTEMREANELHKQTLQIHTEILMTLVGEEVEDGSAMDLEGNPVRGLDG